MSEDGVLHVSQREVATKVAKLADCKSSWDKQTEPTPRRRQHVVSSLLLQLQCKQRARMGIALA